MKNTIKYTMILLAAALMASCSDFLEKRPYDAVDPDMAVTEDVAENLIGLLLESILPLLSQIPATMVCPLPRLQGQLPL